MLHSACSLPCTFPQTPLQVSKVEKRISFSCWIYLWCKYSLIADAVVRGMRAKVLSALCGKQMHADLNSWDFYLSPPGKWAASCPHLGTWQWKKIFHYSFFLSLRQWGKGLACIFPPKRRASPFQQWNISVRLKIVRLSSFLCGRKVEAFFFPSFSVDPLKLRFREFYLGQC